MISSPSERRGTQSDRAQLDRAQSDQAQPAGPRHDFRLVPAALLAWALVAWCVERASSWSLAAALCCVGLAAVVRSARVTVTAGLVALVAVATAWQVAQVEGSPLRAWADAGVVADLQIVVTVDGRAYRAPGGEALVVSGRVAVAASRLGLAHRPGDVVVFIAPQQGQDALEAADLTVGRRLHVTGRLAPADSTADVATVQVLEVAMGVGTPWWWAFSERVRAGVRGAVAHAPPDPRGLVPALVDGDIGAIPDRLDENFRRSGLTHLLAVSGTNLTIVVAAVLGAARAVGVGRRWWVLLGLLAVVGFVLVARPEPSVLRAAAMGVVGLVALGLGTAGGVRALSLAVVALLTVDPWLGRSAGFVLSVSATAGIVVLTPLLVARMSWCPRWASVAVAVPVAAQAACTPALVALSGEVSVVAVLANLVVAPAVAPTTVAGLLGGLLWLVAPPVAAVVGTVAAWCARWIAEVGHAAGELPGASITWSGPWWLSLVATPVAVVALWWVLRHPALLLGLVLGLTLVVWRPPSPGWPPSGWVVVACDVGQGDGLVVNAGGGAAVVIDTGMDPGPIDQCLKRLGIDRVVALVLTHADADHVAGWEGVARGRLVERVLVGPSGGPDVPGADRRQVAAGDSVVLGDVRLEVIWPVTRDLDLHGDRNDLSLVLRLAVDGVTVLLAGDLEPVAQRALLRSGATVSADVLKVPHHGSAHQDLAFLAATGAEAALLSAGVDNDYGHPAPSTLQRLGELGMTQWRTDRQGDLAVVVDDGRWRVVARD